MNAQDIEAIVGTPASPIPEDVIEESDDWLLDAETGTIVGRLDVADHFHIDSTVKAEWALRLRGEIEAQVAALDARLEALRANLLALRAEQVRRLSWWDWRFGSQLADFARRMLAGGKKRTWTCAWGRVSFRKSQGRTEILDMEAAVAWMERWNPALVKVERSVSKKDVLEVAAQAPALPGEEYVPPKWLRIDGEGERVTIDTGIRIANRKGNDDDDNGD
jgi:hypothetical protein